MAAIRVVASNIVDAKPADVYALLADYENGHPRILPRRWFQGLAIERGGVGAGTLIRFQVRLFGVTRSVRAVITEPVRGRVLVETDIDTGAVTTFTLEPLDGGERTSVTITTEWTPRGVTALPDRLFGPGLLQRIYREELRNLACEMAAQPLLAVA